MAKTSPTQRTIAELKKLGYTVAIVERWNPYARIRQDLFGFIDILGIKPGEILAIQATDHTSHSKRRIKSLAHKNFPIWIAAGGKFEIWSFRKAGPRGKRKIWTVRKESLSPTS